MSLLDRARLDNAFISSNINDFAVIGNFTSHVAGETASVGVLHTKHHLSVDYDGDASNTKISSIGVNESILNAQFYPTRENQEVNMEGDNVTIPDSSGVNKSYVVIETFADETLGLIILILGDINI